MHRTIIGNYKVDLYDSIEEMNIERYMAYNKYILIESGIGSTPEDIERNIGKVISYVNNKDKDNSLKQLMLLKQNLYFVMEGQSPELMTFACLIHSINGDLVTDISIENLNRILDKFKNKLTIKAAREILESIKKK